MHIALLRPAATDTPEGRLGELLARGLSAGEVESFAVDGTRSGESRAVDDLIARAREFDLVHLLCGRTPLALASSLPVPVVTTLHREPAGEERELVERLRGRVWIVGGGRDGSSGCDGSTHIPTPGSDAGEREVAEAVEAYAQLYGRALAAAARRRADSEHDRRPWGEYWVLADMPGYKVKRIDVLPGKRLSYQRHAQRAEHWVVVSGRALVTLDGVERELGPGESIDVPLGAAHRVANPGPELLSFVEVQHGSYFGEDDIERLSDDFGR
jgi:mannose-6-phosphate isomerase